MMDDFNVIKHKIIDDGKCKFTFGIDQISNIDFSYYDMHYELEIGIVLSGSVIRHYSNTTIELNPGQVWLTSVWEPHGMKVMTPPAEIAIFFIKPDAISNMSLDLTPEVDCIAPFFSEPGLRPQVYDEYEKSTILDIARRAKETLARGCKNSEILIKLLSLELLTRIQENWITTPQKTNRQINNYIKINPALDLLFHNRKLITIKDAAKECGLSEKSFSRTFKKIMGVTFSQYSLGYRVRSSAKDLVNTDMPIKDVVYNWGFADESHYNKLFHKYYNCNPGVYRKMKKNR